MSPRRMCEDCGIAAWQSCVCDGDAGLDHPHVPNIYSELAPDRDGCSADQLDPASGSPSQDAGSCCSDEIDRRFAPEIQRDDQARDEAA